MKIGRIVIELEPYTDFGPQKIKMLKMSVRGNDKVCSWSRAMDENDLKSNLDRYFEAGLEVLKQELKKQYESGHRYMDEVSAASE